MDTQNEAFSRCISGDANMSFHFGYVKCQISGGYNIEANSYNTNPPRGNLNFTTKALQERGAVLHDRPFMASGPKMPWKDQGKIHEFSPMGKGKNHPNQNLSGLGAMLGLESVLFLDVLDPLPETDWAQALERQNLPQKCDDSHLPQRSFQVAA